MTPTPLHPIFYVINRKLNQVESFTSSKDVATYMLGRNIKFHLIIKTTWDADGNSTDRLVINPSANVDHLELQLNLV